MEIIRTFGHVMGGTLLVSGMTLGFGILSLPEATGAAGFIPSLFSLLLGWVFTLCTSLLILEACIWMPRNANLATLSSHLLGKWGKGISWTLYPLLFFCLMTMQIAAGGEIVTGLSEGMFPRWLSTFLYVGIFSPVVYLGILWVDRLNLVLFAVMALALFFFAASSAGYISSSLLARSYWGQIGTVFPAVLMAFGSQSLIPTLFNYMNRNVAKVRFALIIGTLIPLLFYVLWEFIVLGTVSAGNTIRNPAVLRIIRIIAFFAITASFLGISKAFVDFLFDALKLRKKGKTKALICLAIFFAALLMAMTNLPLSVSTLAIGSGIGLLFGAVPVLMVWAGRYDKGYSLLHQQLPGGKITLSLLLAFIVSIFFMAIK